MSSYIFQIAMAVVHTGAVILVTFQPFDHLCKLFSWWQFMWQTKEAHIDVESDQVVESWYFSSPEYHH